MSTRRAALLLLLAACQASTTRPVFQPLPLAPQLRVELTVSRATAAVAEALQADSIPVSRVEPRDGYLETPWFDTATGRPTGRRPLGQGIVRIRAWIDPTRPGHSQVTLEASYREVADPSLPERELDRELPAEHPVRKRLDAIVTRLNEAFGEPGGT